MKHIYRRLGLLVVMLVVLVGGCADTAEISEKQDITNLAATGEEPRHEGQELRREGRGEHDRDGEGHHDEGREGGHDEAGEESGAEYALNETYDQVRNGARLIIAYDAPSNSFLGTVENTTNDTLQQVRVEVHLSNGKELGPTVPGDLAPGEKREIKLAATSNDFDKWNAHPEVGVGEHGHEGSGEHDEGEEGNHSEGSEASGEHGN